MERGAVCKSHKSAWALVKITKMQKWRLAPYPMLQFIDLFLNYIIKHISVFRGDIHNTHL